MLDGRRSRVRAAVAPATNSKSWDQSSCLVRSRSLRPFNGARMVENLGHGNGIGGSGRHTPREWDEIKAWLIGKEA